MLNFKEKMNNKSLNIQIYVLCFVVKMHVKDLDYKIFLLSLRCITFPLLNLSQS